MDHAGAIPPDKLKSFHRERCPDWDGRPVIRLSQDDVRWILWQGPVGLSASSKNSQSACESSWQQVAFADHTSEHPDLQVGVLNSGSVEPRAAWLAVELQSVQSVDLLVDCFGDPPREVLCDWQDQIGQQAMHYRVKDSAEATSNSESQEPSPVLLSHFLVSVDGRLVSLAAIEATVRQEVANQSDSSSLRFSLPIPDVGLLQGAQEARQSASLSIHDLLKDAAQSIASRVPDSSRTAIPARSPSTPLVPAKIGSLPNKRHRSPKLLWLSSVAVCLTLIAGLMALMNSDSKQTARDGNASTLNVASKSETATPTEWGPEEKEPIPTLELTRDERNIPENSLDDQASNSLQSLFGSVGAGNSPISIEPISFESVSETLKDTNDEAIVMQSLAESTSEDSFAKSKSTAPFPEPLDAVSTTSQETMGSTTAESAQSQPGIENQAEPNFVTHSLPIQQAQSKSTFRVPFKPNDRQAVCRVKLKMDDDILLKPVEAVELVGRQDTIWTVALNDDSVSLSVYLRSVPAKSWYIASAVRLRLAPDMEIPIGRNDATLVCRRLQYHLNWLDQNRMVGESMRSNKKKRSMAIAGLEQIEKQTKATEKSLKNWLVIEKLVLAFYQDNAIELELASAIEKLPER